MELGPFHYFFLCGSESILFSLPLLPNKKNEVTPDRTAALTAIINLVLSSISE